MKEETADLERVFSWSESQVRKKNLDAVTNLMSLSDDEFIKRCATQK